MPFDPRSESYQHLHTAYERYAREIPSSAAIITHKQQELSWSDCLVQIQYIIDTLQSIGVPPASPILTMMSDGPELALIFIALTTTFTHIPLRHNTSKEELQRLLEQVDALALVVDSPPGDDFLTEASKAGIAVIYVTTNQRSKAGTFFLRTILPPRKHKTNSISSDICLILLTSGTTSRPKLVPLTQQNLLSSSCHIRDSFELTKLDRRLNIMPLSHVQGLIGGILAPLQAGGSVICTRTFDPCEFLDLLKLYQPTWYSGVPTMHNEIVATISHQQINVKGSTLRFIRNGSFPLKTEDFYQLEQAFGVPVIEAYGMSEATSQIACNPLPPKIHKPRSAGLPAGPDIAIVDSNCNQVNAGQIGEILVRGPNVITGYLNEESRASFCGDWFRTGDLGRFDDDGYLYLEGRLKDLINRGGDKILPAEVEHVLLKHKDISDALVFSVPDERLGEEVAAALIASPDSLIDLHLLSAYLSDHLPEYKLPQHFLILSEFPRGITGKVLKEELIRKITTNKSSSDEQRVTRLDENPALFLQEIWCRILRLPIKPDVNDDFFDLGGSSLQMQQVLAEIDQKLGRRLYISLLMPRVTINRMLYVLQESSREIQFYPLVPMKEGIIKPHLFLIHPAGGSLTCYKSLVRRLDIEQSIYGIQCSEEDLDGDTSMDVTEIASKYIQLIQRVQTSGPYALAGWSLGGIIAFEMARQLGEIGESTSLLAMIDSLSPNHAYQRPHEIVINKILSQLDHLDLNIEHNLFPYDKMWYCMSRELSADRDDVFLLLSTDYQRRVVIATLTRLGILPHADSFEDDYIRTLMKSLFDGYCAARKYRSPGTVGSLLYFRAGSLPEQCSDDSLGWSNYVEGDLRVIPLDANHFNIFEEESLSIIAAELSTSLREKGIPL
jgi:acyl-CoA synthetase (AMP-forming)/AMP-acid ligase II/thioesterase domain-containing protein